MLIRILLLFFITTIASANEQGNSIRIVFDEKESGVDTYRVRMIIKGDKMRIEDDRSENEFILFDNKESVIYSVSGENKNILVIKKGKFNPSMSGDINFVQEQIKDIMFPNVAGKKPQAWRITASEQLCNFIVAVPGLLESSVEMMKGYATLLSYEHAVVQMQTPAEMNTACDTLNHITQPTLPLSFGFPIRESRYDGHQRSLVDFDENFIASDDLFKLPAGYKHYSRQDIR